MNVYDRSIDELELSVRAYNCLKVRTGIQTVGDLCRLTKADLLDIRHLGVITLNEIRHELRRLGVTLTGEEI